MILYSLGQSQVPLNYLMVETHPHKLINDILNWSDISAIQGIFENDSLFTLMIKLPSILPE